MDGLDEFEKQLAAEKADARRVEESRPRGRRHRHRHHSRAEERDRNRDGHRHRHGSSYGREKYDDHDHDSDGQSSHRHKRPRHYRNGHDKVQYDRRHLRAKSPDESFQSERDVHEKVTDSKQDLPLPAEEMSSADTSKSKKPTRDDWMTDPNILGVDYTQRGSLHGKKELTPLKMEARPVIHAREMNAEHLKGLDNCATDTGASDDGHVPAQQDVGYNFGDEGSQWRMTKLKAVFSTAERTSRPVEEVALEKYGNLREFDDAREERIELDRRQTYGDGYVGKTKPNGDLFEERKTVSGGASREHGKSQQSRATVEPDQDATIPDGTLDKPARRLDSTALNKLRAQMMKAKLRRAPEAQKLEAEYERAVASEGGGGSNDIVLNVMENRMLAGRRAEAKAVNTKRGRERGLVEENQDMSIEDMVIEERRNRGRAGGDGLRLAERIAKDAEFDDDIDYMDENAEKLARRVQKSELNLKNVAVGEFQKINRILDKCPLCHQQDWDQPPVAPIIALATRTYLTLPTEPELADGGAVIVPVQHRTNLLECDDDEWEEMRNFMKCLTRMYHDQGREVVFYENAAAPYRHPHAAMSVVPIPYELGDTAPAFFREAMLSADEEWAQHRKIIDTGGKARDGLGKLAFRRSIAKEMPYFHVWFTLDGGLGHVVEDSDRWPRGDLFAREIIGGMLDVGPDVIKKQGRWHRGDQRVEGFRKRWRKFDWTRVLVEG